MRHLSTILLLLALLILVESAPAQRRRPPGGRDKPLPERIDRFKKMRLVEVLDLKEEEAVRFFSKQHEHDKKLHDLTVARQDAIDNVGEKVRGKADPNEYQKLVDEILDIDQKMFTERRRFQDELRSSLTPEQFAKFLVFERNFNQHLRDAMEGMRRERLQRNRD